MNKNIKLNNLNKISVKISEKLLSLQPSTENKDKIDSKHLNIYDYFYS